MTHPSPELADLARRIVEQEAGASSDPASSAAGADIACVRLTNHLVDLLGAGGVTALLRRALHLAQRERPLLADVVVSERLDTCYSGLAEALASKSDEEARAAASAVFTHLLDLLVVLLGEDLGMKPVRKLWPQASARESDL